MVAPMNRRREERAAEAAAGRSGARSSRGSWLTAAAIARVAGGEVVRRGSAAATVTTDSRAECTGKLFVALRGENHDGHRFVMDAIRRGAAGLLIDRPLAELPELAELGRGWPRRSSCRCPIPARPCSTSRPNIAGGTAPR
jgi:hypothetical protein